MLHLTLGAGLASETLFASTPYNLVRAVTGVDLLNGTGMIVDWHRGQAGVGGVGIVLSTTSQLWPGAGGGPISGLYTFLEDGFTINLGASSRLVWSLREERDRLKIISYVGNGAVNRPLAHGLDSAPACWINLRASDSDMKFWSNLLPAYDRFLNLRYNSAVEPGTGQGIAPDGTNIYVSAGLNQSGVSYHMLALLPSQHTTYTGSGSPQPISGDGLLIVKSLDAVGDWLITDRANGLGEHAFFNLEDVALTGAFSDGSLTLTDFIRPGEGYLVLGFD